MLGSIYSNNLETALPAAVASTPGFPPAAATSPEQLWALPVDLRTPVVDVYAAALHNVFLYAVPVALLALVVAFFLPQVTLRGRDGAGGTGEGFAIPEGADADTQLENIIGEVLRRKGGSAAPDVLTASGSSLDIPTSWGVMGVYLRYAITGAARQSSIEERVGVPPGVLRSFFDEIVADGYLTRAGDLLKLTAAGQAEVNLITAAWRNWLVDELREWLPDSDSEIDVGGPPAPRRVDAALDRIVIRLIRESELEVTPNQV